MQELKDLQDELKIARKLNFDKREIEHLERLIEKEQNKREKKKSMSIREFFLWIIGIICMAMVSFSAYPKNIIIYELILDYGNDYAFIIETTFSKERCEKKAAELKKSEKAKAYCLKRG